MSDLERHDAVRAIVEATVAKWNRGRWVKAVATVEHSPFDGRGTVTVNRDGDGSMMRYHLPETVEDIVEMVHALCEDPSEWKSRHRRDYGRPA